MTCKWMKMNENERLTDNVRKKTTFIDILQPKTYFTQIDLYNQRKKEFQHV